MSLVSHPDPSACSNKQRSVEVQDKIYTEQDDETQNVDLNQYDTPAPLAEREDDQTSNDGALVLENRSASVPATGSEATSIASHQVTTPFVKPDCVETNPPFDLSNCVRPVRIDDTALPFCKIFRASLEKESITHTIQVGDGDEENGFVTATPATKEPALGVEVLMDNDCLETHKDIDLTVVVLADKGKGVDPREYGGALYNPNSMIVPAGTASTSTGGLGTIELVHRGKGKDVNPEEGGIGTVKYEPGPSRIDFHDHGVISFQKQNIPLQSFGPRKTTDLNDRLPYDPTLPRLSWFPKISPYRFVVFSIPLAIGTVKAVLSQKGRVTTPITLEWISGVVIFLVFFLLESYETCRDIPKYLLWLFKPDCVDLVWYFAPKLSIQRPEYLSNERDLESIESDLGAFVTSYRILVSVAVAFLGSLKATFTYSSLFTGAIWVEWLFVGFVLSLLYFVGLYENNSLGLGSSFFRKDRSHFIRMDFGSVISLPSIVGLAFILVIYSVQLIPGIKRNARQAVPDFLQDSQLPMVPTLSKGTLEEIFLIVVFYMPFIIVYACLLFVLVSQLWAPILASTSILPSGIRYYTSRFFGAVERLAQRRPIDRIIYHSVAFAQLLLLLTLNVWIVLFLCFVDVIVEMTDDILPPLLFKVVLYTGMITLFISSWFIAATSDELEEMRWWPTRDHLSRLFPSSFANATVTTFIQKQAKTLRRLRSSIPSDFPKCRLFLFVAFYIFFIFIMVFAGSYALIVNKSFLTSALLPVMVTVFILLAFTLWMWFYIGVKLFPDILWRMRPLLHYGFQDFTESVRESIELYNLEY